MITKIKKGLLFAVICLAVLWTVMLISLLFPGIQQLGIIPRTIKGLPGILLCPLIHGSWGHIISNSIPLLVLITTLIVSYRNLAFRVILLSVIIADSLVWLFGRGDSVHIGASGLIFSLIGFLICNVFFRRDWKSLIIACCIGFFYGTTIFGILPGGNPQISWEGHLFGFLTGIGIAFAFRKSPSN